MYEILTPDFCYTDERGSLTQLVHGGWNQVNVIFSRRDTVRGGHYHKKNREAFYVVNGSCEVTLTIDGEEKTQVFKSGDFFSIEPNTFHLFRYLEDTLLVSLYDVGVNGGVSSLRHLEINSTFLNRQFFCRGGAAC